MKKAWSFSSLSQYKTCPRQYHEQRNLKTFAQAPNESALYGERGHKVIELAVKKDVPVPNEFRHVQRIIDQVRRAEVDYLEVEVKLAIDKDRNPVEFLSEHVWCRGVVDLLGVNGSTAVATDWKFGKRKLTDQLRLMALLIFANYPIVNKVHTGFVWVGLNGKVDQETFEREEIDRLWGTFDQDLSNMAWSYEMGVWPERPSGLCKRFCPVTTCKHNGGYRRG